uniref:Uncharacterized protein n=1 Tax=Setaria digitata TaxID=48799 RepID=A0A915PMD3_9BILA
MTTEGRIEPHRCVTGSSGTMSCFWFLSERGVLEILGSLAKAISEYTGKELLYRHLKEFPFVEKPQALKLTTSDSFDVITDKVDWLADNKIFLSSFMRLQKSESYTTYCRRV